ncbi:hypothetical protein ERY430_80488 [Erythrobacter sp. EC-HK427]|nr:hypothetical protein ERY430_80488 [Erythrobacter sp. EC-HK427]
MECIEGLQKGVERSKRRKASKVKGRDYDEGQLGLFGTVRMEIAGFGDFARKWCSGGSGRAGHGAGGCRSGCGRGAR